MTEAEKDKRIELLEKRLGIGEHDPAKKGYVVLVEILRQQNDYLKEIQIKSMITSDDKAKTDEYKRAKELWEKLPEMIRSVSTLKAELKVEDNDTKETLKPITAKQIADGNVLPN